MCFGRGFPIRSLTLPSVFVISLLLYRFCHIAFRSRPRVQPQASVIGIVKPALRPSAALYLPATVEEAAAAGARPRAGFAVLKPVPASLPYVYVSSVDLARVQESPSITVAVDLRPAVWSEADPWPTATLAPAAGKKKAAKAAAPAVKAAEPAVASKPTTNDSEKKAGSTAERAGSAAATHAGAPAGAPSTPGKPTQSARPEPAGRPGPATPASGARHDAHQQGRQGSTPARSPYDRHLDRDEALRLIAAGELYRAQMRINAKNPQQAFATVRLFYWLPARAAQGHRV